MVRVVCPLPILVLGKVNARCMKRFFIRAASDRGSQPRKAQRWKYTRLFGVSSAFGRDCRPTYVPAQQPAKMHLNGNPTPNNNGFGEDASAVSRLSSWRCLDSSQMQI